jgi:hypothetical protein
VDQPAAAAPVSTKAAARTRFALLLIISDVLHTDKFHQRSTGKQGIFSKESMTYLPELVELAASYISEKHSPAEKKMRAILNYWAVNGLCSAEDLGTLRSRTDEALLVAQGGTVVRRRNYLLPEYHGDLKAPWFDLPASYMLEQMIKHPDRPIDPHRIKTAKLDKKPVSLHVRKLLDNYFENIDLKYFPTGDNPTGETKKHKLWLDPMGQLVKQDKETGEIATVYNGYGWSTKLCQDMQKDGVPETIKKAREDLRREEELEKVRVPPQRRRRSPLPRRRRYSSSSSKESFRRERSHSRRSSQSSIDSRDSRAGSRERFHSNRPHSPKNARGDDRYDVRGREQARAPSRPHGREQPSPGAQWNGSNTPAYNIPSGPASDRYPHPPKAMGQGFSQAQQPPFSAPSYMPQTPMPMQFPGQFPMQPFPPPPPPPFQPGAFPGGIPPPPPPHFSGPFPPPPPIMSTMANSPYNFGGNQFSNAYGNNYGQGNNQGHGQNQGNFQVGRGGFRGNFQGGANNSRGGYGGQQRGQRGGRW